ncbi:MAG: sigma 54-dependent Fis family transcriptional regulator [Deltaproteobacteria bacterium]|nr:sigma 54-dependent Fis family transcriptional regulator [Deltaproteobacteria bacterium]
MSSDSRPLDPAGAPGRSRQTVVVTDRSEIRLQRSKLVQMTGAAKGSEFELTLQRTVVGSGADCTLVIPDLTVSQHHFAVDRDEQSYLVRDLESTNGTFLDNARVKEAYLRPGALIRAGEIYLRFEPVYERIDLVPSEATHFGGLVGASFRMREIFAVLEKVAPTEATILLQGETGTGKGAVARAIHQSSARQDGPFAVFDCGAIAPTLVESELFGHERGAFTGAVPQRRGALEQASAGTLFIDELSSLALDLQPKLLRALEDREFMRVGSNKQIKMDCRIIAATQRDLWSEVSAGRFREDLYFRLAVVTIPLPALRDRREDVPLLVDGFLRDLNNTAVKSFDALEPAHKQRLLAHDWPGNIRELRNTIERLGLMEHADPFLSRSESAREAERAAPAAAPTPIADLPTVPGPASPTLPVSYDLPFKDAKEVLVTAFEREYLRRLLARVDNNIARAAREANIDRKHLYTLLAKHGLASGGADNV